MWPDQSRTEIDETLAVFVETEAYSRAVHALQSKGHVVIRGPPGCGKSSLGHALLHYFSRGQRSSSNLPCEGFSPADPSTVSPPNDSANEERVYRQYPADPSTVSPPNDSANEEMVYRQYPTDPHTVSPPNNSANEQGTGRKYTPLVVRSFEEWRLHVGGQGRHQVVLLDNVLGTGHLDHTHLHKWKDSFQTLLSYAAKRKCLIVLTVNDHVWEELQDNKPQLPDLQIFHQVVDLSSFSLSDGEKREILAKHFVSKGKTVPENIQDILRADVTGPLFASLCRKLADCSEDTSTLLEEFLKIQGESKCDASTATLDIPLDMFAPNSNSHLYKTDSRATDYKQHSFLFSSKNIMRKTDGSMDLGRIENETPLLAACRKNDAHQVEKLLLQGENPNTPASSGTTALHIASFSGALKIVEDLRGHQAQPDIQDNAGWTPLHLASQEGHVLVVQTLLSASPPLPTKRVKQAPTDHQHRDLLKDFSLCTSYTRNQYGRVTVCRKCFSRNKLAIDNLSRHDSFINRRSGPNGDGVTALYLACQNGHTQVVKCLLERGACAELYVKLNRVEVSALEVACCQGYMDVVRLLLSYRTSIPVSLLHAACFHGHANIVGVLLDHFTAADLDRDGDGNLPLHLAAQLGHTRVVQLILERQRPDNIDMLTTKGQTPLHLACQTGNVGTVKLLIEHGASVTATCCHRTPLQMACERGDAEIVQVLAENNADVHCAVNDADSKDIPIVTACRKCEDQIFAILCRYGASLDCGDKRNGTLLHVACSAACRYAQDESGGTPRNNRDKHRRLVDKAHSSQRLVIVQKLLGAGIDVNATTQTGKTALHAACENETADQQMVAVLLQHGASVDTTHGRHTALHYACKNSNVDPGIVSALLQQGANVNARKFCDQTPFRLCQWQSGSHFEDVVRQLLEHGAEIFDSSHRDFLQSSGHFYQTVLSYMTEHGIKKPNGESALHTIVKEFSDHFLTEHLRQHDTDIDVRDGQGRTPLMMAILECGESTVDILLDKGASVEVRDAHGWTPVRYCVAAGRANLLKRLLDNGADVHETDSSGNSLLHQVCMRADHRFFSITNEQLLILLLNSGCCVNSVNHDGNTPLHLACENDSQSLVQILLEHGALTHLTNKAAQSPEEITRDVNPDLILLFPAQGEDELGSEESSGECDTDDSESGAREGVDDGMAGGSQVCQHNDCPTDTEKEDGVRALSTAPRQPVSFQAAQELAPTDVSEKVLHCNEYSKQGIPSSDTAAAKASAVSAVVMCSSSLHDACFHGDRGRLLDLIQVGDDAVNAVCDHGRTPLHYACSGADVATTQTLLLNGANTSATCSKGRTALHDASERGDANVVDLLLTHGVEVDKVDSTGRTALHLACGSGQSTTTALLLASKADVNCAESHGRTPLHSTCGSGQSTTTALLLASKADVNCADEEGNTPLHLACSGGHTDVSLLLLHWGADQSVRNLLSQTAMDVARAAFHGALVKVLMRHLDQ